MQRAWRPFLLLGLLVFGGYYLLPSAPVQNVCYDVVSLVCVLAILAGIRIHRPQRTLFWYLLAAGQALFLAGDVLWGVYDQVLHVEPFPSKADVLYLLGYPVLAVALMVLLRDRSPGHDRRGLIDATVIAVGLSMLAWVFLIRPFADDPTLSLVGQAISVAYPAMDILLVGVASRLALVSGARVPSYYFLGASLLALLIADGIYGYGNITGAFDTGTGSLVDGVYLLPYLFMAVAALHPSMARLASHDPLPRPRLSWGRVMWLGAASLTAPAVLAIQALRHEPIDVPVIVAGSAVLFLLVLARMAGLLREVETTAEELELQGTALRATLSDLRDAESDRRRLLDRVLSGADEERRRVADELHDGPIQRLASLQYGLERGRLQLERGQTESAAALIGDLAEQLSHETGSLRKLMAELRPPALDESGLVGAVRDQVAGFGRQTGVATELHADVEVRLDPELETVLYRVIQEALTNVAKHARARHVDVTLRSMGGSIELDVTDDGVGFDRGQVRGLARNGHIGLVAMRERVEMAGGTWHVESAPNEGTRVHVTFEKAKVG